jgi:hypothetical protein
VTGARPQTEITLVHSSWDLPESFPVGWGPVARAHLAQAAWKHSLSTLRSSPVFSSLGVRGATMLSVSVDPSACYIALLAPIRGQVQNMALAVSAGSRVSEAHAEPDSGASVSFCAKGTSQVAIEAQALGTGIAWIRGLWRVGGTS